MTQAVKENFKFGAGWQVPPFRSLDEFILERARFEVPPLHDLRRWNNRILSNLLYYQTNYFAMTIVILFLMCIVQAEDACVGLSAIAMVVGAAVFFFSPNQTLAEVRQKHRLVALAAALLSIGFFVYVISSVAKVTVTLLVAILLVFCHASVRLRNLKSKINYQVERIGLKNTAMARLFEFACIDFKDN